MTSFNSTQPMNNNTEIEANELCYHCEEPKTDINRSYCSDGCEDAENDYVSEYFPGTTPDDIDF